MTAVSLWANIGAEEDSVGVHGRPLGLSPPIVRQVAELWSLLFRPDAQLLPDRIVAAWPPALRKR